MYLLWMNLFLSIKWHWTNSVLPTGPPLFHLQAQECQGGGARDGEGPLRNFTCSIEDPKM